MDFSAIAEAAVNASEGVEVHGPVEQGRFLEGMGGRERVKALVEVGMEKKKRIKMVMSSGGAAAGAGAGAVGLKDVRDLEKSWERLVDRGPNGMGRIYKALAIVPENDGRRRPVGFGGDVVM